MVLNVVYCVLAKYKLEAELKLCSLVVLAWWRRYTKKQLKTYYVVITSLSEQN